jgi:hypothetical protein
MKNSLFSFLAGAGLLLTTASATHAQSASNGCDLTPAPTSASITAVPNQIMLAHVTDTCPSSTYLDEQYVVNGEFDGSTHDYLLARTVVKSPQLTDEVMILVPSSNDYFWYGAGKGSLQATTNMDLTRSPLNADQTAAANRADLYTQAAAGVQQTLIGSAPDTTPPYGRWLPGMSKTETAAAAAAKQVPAPAPVATDACGDVPALYPHYLTVRYALVTATCTETTFAKVANPGVANWQVGGSQFGMTSTSSDSNGPWLLYATAMADDNSSELLVLVPQPLGDLTQQTSDVNTMAPANSDLGILKFGLQLIKIGVISNTNPLAIGAGLRTPLAGTHDYYLSWIAAGQPAN